MFEVLSFKMRVEQCAKGVIETEAILKVNVDGEIKDLVGESNDIKDAFYRALCKALLPTYPCLAELKVVCYEVFELKDDDFVVASIFFSDGEKMWGKMGESVNACEAILKALIAGFKRMIEKTG